MTPRAQHIGGLPLAALAMASLAVVGCAELPWRKSQTVRYETVASSKRHDVATAKVKHAEALAILDSDKSEKHLPKAENLLNEALVADVRYGPAHNTLGMVYYLQQKLYLAAWEFEYAAKLMPNNPEPYNNLGLVYERAGKYEDAISYYSMAMSHDAENPQIVGNLVRARLANGEKGDDLKTMISDLALYHPDPTWQRWARDQVSLAKFETPKSLREGWQRDVTPPEALPAPLVGREELSAPGPLLSQPESVLGDH